MTAAGGDCGQLTVGVTGDYGSLYARELWHHAR
jgi:hypothetical protein